MEAMFIVNFKTYPESTGERAVILAKMIGESAQNSNIETVICPQAVDVRWIIDQTQVTVWAQHVDVYSEGQSTGWLPPQVAKAVGFEGTLLNHSEHKLEKHMLEEIIHLCSQVGLKTLVFAASQEEALEVAKFKPDFIGYEPPELIASKTTSVAQSRPETIRKIVDLIPDIPILVGAGVKSTEDVRVSLQLGAKGIGAVSSAIILSEDPKSKIDELLQGFE